MKIKKNGIISSILLCILISATLAISGCGDGGVPTIQTSSTARTADLSGTVYVPADVSGARMAGRVASVVGQDTPLAGATVAVKRMKSNGTLEAIGTDYSTTTNSSGQFTIENVSEEENLIIEATKAVSISGTQATLTLKKVVSITETDSTAGQLSNLNLNVSTTLGAEAMKDIIVVANQNVSDADKISGKDLARETITDIESGIDTALAADQTSGTPAVDLAAVITNGDTAVDAQLADLENSPNGTTVKNLK